MIRRRSRNVMNLKPLSVLSRAEIYSCIYYFYYILSVAQDELNQADCVDFLLNIVNQLKMEDRFSQLLSGYVEELEKDNTLKKVDSEKTTYIEGTELEEKYTCDKFINRIIPRGKRINNFNVNLYRVLYSEDSKIVFQLIISDLFFPQSIYENTSTTAFIERGGRRTGLHEYIDEDNEWDEDEIDNEDINPMSLEIDEKKLPLKIKRAINDLSKVRFLMDNAGLSKKEAEILLILYRCQTIKPLYEQYSRIQSCFELVIQKIMHLSSREYSMLINKNGKLHSFGFLDENNCIEDDLTDCIDCGNLDRLGDNKVISENAKRTRRSPDYRSRGACTQDRSSFKSHHLPPGRCKICTGCRCKIICTAGQGINHDWRKYEKTQRYRCAGNAEPCCL